MLQVTHVRFSSSGTEHKHITQVRTYNPAKASGKVADYSVEAMVKWLTDPNAQRRAYVCDGSNIVEVQVAKNAKPPYLHTGKDGIASDNLLNLPTF